MWKTESGIIEIILEFFSIHFPDAHIGSEKFRICLKEVLTSYESSKREPGNTGNSGTEDLHGTPSENVENQDTDEICQEKAAQDTEEPGQSSFHASGAELRTVPSSSGARCDDNTDYFPCAFCGEIFPTHEAYEAHAVSHHAGESRDRSHHECDVCGRCFNNYLSFKRHRINHSLVKPYTCELCSRSFTRNHDLQRHKANVHRIRSFFASDAVRILNRHMLLSCQRCRLRFPSRALLEEHLQFRKCSEVTREGNGVIGGNGPFLCERCGMTFEQSSHLAEHRRSSACRGGPPRPPPNVTFPSESLGPLLKLPRPDEASWKMEVAEDSEEEPELSCEHCAATFRLATDLVEHRILEHTAVPAPKRRRSDDCSPPAEDRQLLTAFPVTQEVAEEAEEAEEDGDDAREDEEGEEEATDLSIKGRLDTADSPLAKDDLKATETDGKMDVWLCVYCSNSFCNKATLDRHMRTHTGDKPFQCPVCVKRFTRKHDLERHRSNIHDGVRPFTCPMCHKAFPLKKNLTKHLIMTHHVNEASFGYSPEDSYPVS